MTDNHREDVEGHIRRLLDSVPPSTANPVVRPDDTGGHSRFGMFVDPNGEQTDEPAPHDVTQSPRTESQAR